jgi:hypothetical protein
MPVRLAERSYSAAVANPGTRRLRGVLFRIVRLVEDGADHLGFVVTSHEEYSVFGSEQGPGSRVTPHWWNFSEKTAAEIFSRPSMSSPRDSTFPWPPNLDPRRPVQDPYA